MDNAILVCSYLDSRCPSQRECQQAQRCLRDGTPFRAGMVPLPTPAAAPKPTARERANACVAEVLTILECRDEVGIVRADRMVAAAERAILAAETAAAAKAIEHLKQCNICGGLVDLTNAQESTIGFGRVPTP